MRYRHEVYYNLHKQCLSVRNISSGKVVAGPGRVMHFETALLHEVTFAVQPAGNARVRATGRKNVHAFVRGRLEWFTTFMGLSVTGGRPSPALLRRPERLINEIMTNPSMVKITYNPYKFTSFVDQNTLTPVTHADKVYIVGRDIYAIGAK